MENSPFRFTNPELKDLEFKVFDEFQPKEGVTINLSVESRVSGTTTLMETNERTANVSVSVEIGSKDGNNPFYIKATEAAVFKWKQEDFTEELEKTLLRQNAAALLISYIRPVVAGITSASKYPTYNLPFLDMTKLEEDN